MKKICIIFLTLFIITLTAYGFASGYQTATPMGNTTEYLRIHIRADSNEDAAQAVKYLVRDEVVEYLTPVVAESGSKEEALAGVRSRLDEIAQVATAVLQRNGFTYSARARVSTENFPTRVYGEYTLPAGEYAALIVELGSGEGDNWWCVVYPPLCFTSAYGKNGVIYKSKLLEIIESWGKK